MTHCRAVVSRWWALGPIRFLLDYMYDFLKQVVPGISKERIEGYIASAGISADAHSNVIPLPPPKPVQTHPTFGEQFGNCCDGFTL